MSDLGNSDEIIEQIYALVSAPEGYDRFMLDLQSQLDALPARGEPSRAKLISGHLKRASELVDIITPWRRETDDGLTAELGKKHQATFVLNASGCLLYTSPSPRDS